MDQRGGRVVPHAANDGGFTVAKFVGAVRTHPRLSSFIVLWILLAISFVYAPAPLVVTPAMQQKFEATLAKVPMRQIYSARLERDEAADYVQEAQVWFWRFRPEYRAEVERRQPELDRAQARLDELEAERDAIMVEARQVVGIWSEYGVEEARQKFWQNVQAGKDAAKRATMWNALFSSFSMRRDESIVSFLLGLVVKFVFNLTFGLVLMLIAFLFSLGGIVWSFSPGLLNGTLFFLVAALGATAVVTSIITLRTSYMPVVLPLGWGLVLPAVFLYISLGQGVFGGLGGGVYLMARAAMNDPNRRLGGGAQRPRVSYGQQYQHYRRD